jgi:hypothetical protein
MNRLYNLLTVMVLTAVAFFAAPEALAKVLTGTSGEDNLKGLREADRLNGGPGEDHLKGNSGNDRIWGGRGDDKIIPGYGDDKVYAGYGDDLIYARDTDGVDFIDCGPGFDQVETIHRDDVTLSNCERTLGPDRGHIETDG